VELRGRRLVTERGNLLGKGDCLHPQLVSEKRLYGRQLA